MKGSKSVLTYASFSVRLYSVAVAAQEPHRWQLMTFSRVWMVSNQFSASQDVSAFVYLFWVPDMIHGTWQLLTTGILSGINRDLWRRDPKFVLIENTYEATCIMLSASVDVQLHRASCALWPGVVPRGMGISA